MGGGSSDWFFNDCCQAIALFSSCQNVLHFQKSEYINLKNFFSNIISVFFFFLKKMRKNFSQKINFSKIEFFIRDLK